MRVVRPLGDKLPRPKPLTRNADVTIAAGFRFSDGMLICADTKHAADYSFDDSKIFTTVYHCGARTVFAFAGSMHFARMAIQQCDQAILLLPMRTISTMRDAIESVLLSFHEKHIFPHPDRRMEGGPDFNFLIGLWSPLDERSMLLCTDQTATNELHTYDCIGSGRYLGHYIIRPRYRTPEMSLRKVILLATTALMRIKGHDAACGGQSEFAILKNDGELSEVARFDISQDEGFAEAFYTAATYLYEKLAEEEDLDEKRWEGDVSMMMSAVRDTKEQQIRAKAARARLMVSLLNRAGIKTIRHDK